MNIYGVHHIVQHRRCQLLQVQVFLCLSDKSINILRLIFLILYFVFEHFNLDSQVSLFPLVIIRQHLKTSFGQFAVDHVLVNTLKQSVQFSQTIFGFLQGSLFGRKVFLCFLASLCTQRSAERILIIGNTLDHQPHVLKCTFFQHNGSDEVSIADLLALFTGSGAYEVVLSGFKTVAGAVVQFLTAIGTADEAGEHIGLACSGGSALVLAKLLHTGEGFFVNNRFMGVFENLPLLWRVFDFLFCSCTTAYGF